jgi:flagellar hook assembly protein FlgD
VVIRGNVVRPAAAQPLHVDVLLEKSQRVTITIYNRNGQFIKTVTDEVANAGTFNAVWEGVNAKGQIVSSGIYIVLIKTDTFEEKRKVVVVR